MPALKGYTQAQLEVRRAYGLESGPSSREIPIQLLADITITFPKLRKLYCTNPVQFTQKEDPSISAPGFTSALASATPLHELSIRVISDMFAHTSLSQVLHSIGQINVLKINATIEPYDSAVPPLSFSKTEPQSRYSGLRSLSVWSQHDNGTEQVFKMLYDSLDTRLGLERLEVNTRPVPVPLAIPVAQMLDSFIAKAATMVTRLSLTVSSWAFWELENSSVSQRKSSFNLFPVYVSHIRLQGLPSLVLCRRLQSLNCSIYWAGTEASITHSFGVFQPGGNCADVNLVVDIFLTAPPILQNARIYFDCSMAGYFVTDILDLMSPTDPDWSQLSRIVDYQTNLRTLEIWLPPSLPESQFAAIKVAIQEKILCPPGHLCRILVTKITRYVL